MSRAHYSEVPAVQGKQGSNAEAFGYSDDGRVDCSDVEFGICGDEFSGAGVVGWPPSTTRRRSFRL
jgi:hypothetical protein